MVEIYRRNGDLYNRLDQGKLFAQMALLTSNKVRFPAKAIKETLLNCIPESIFHDWSERYEDFSDVVEAEERMRLKSRMALS